MLKVCIAFYLQIKVYAAKEYHDEPLQFISNHYFQVTCLNNLNTKLL